MFDAPLLLSLAVAAYLLIACILFARRSPAYRSMSFTISELGAVGSPDCRLVSYGVFLPVGMGLGLVAVLAWPIHPPVAALALSISAGYVIGALFPCDPGSPLASSNRQLVHNFGGAVEYLGGTLSLFVIAESLGIVFRFGGFIVGLSTIVLSFESSVRGLVQRVAETVLFLGLILALFVV